MKLPFVLLSWNTWLGIVGNSPTCWTYGRGDAGSRMLADLSVVGRVRMAGDEEYLADADMRNDFVCDDSAVQARADLHLVPTTCRNNQFRAKSVKLRLTIRRVQSRAGSSPRPRFTRTSARLHAIARPLTRIVPESAVCG
jgi:hypothetical protein